MLTSVVDFANKEALYRGLRVSADEYFRLEEDGFRYELVDGVVCMSPSPTPVHQKVVTRIAAQIVAYLEVHPVGEVFVEVDVHLGAGPRGGDLVYRPDVIFLRTERVAQNQERIVGAPDLVVEVVSNTSRRYDNETKRSDYQRCGVSEYWLIDPDRESMTFLSLEGNHYVEMSTEGDTLKSRALSGFTLNLARVRKSFKPA